MPFSPPPPAAPEALPTPALPAEAPLPTPAAPLHARARPLRRAARPWRQRLRTALARAFVVLSTLALAAYGIQEAWGVISTGGVTALQWVFVILFGLNFTWIAFSLAQTVLGLLAWLARTLTGGRRDHDAAPLELSTAVLLPLYQEAAPAIGANVLAMARQLAARCPERFAIFLLSDTQSVPHWLEEQAVLRHVIENAPDGCPIYYRNRADNAERKAGNLIHWVQHFGAAWDAMLVLDADSLMSSRCIQRLARRLEDNPDLGLIQTLPVVARGQTLYARVQQFAGACYGGLYASGLAAWYGRSGNYWGHNAILRTCAFAKHCRLPALRGRAPFGGHILSHDFVEAAFLRRAGWGVRFDADLGGSFEETPPALIDAMIRDRRWCQGSLQHLGALGARGLRLASRAHLLTGIYSYLSALVWFALVLVGLGLALQVQLVPPDYFAEPSLFPTWPVFDTERAIRLLILTVAVVLTPKVMGALAVVVDPRRWRGYGGPLTACVSTVWETLLSALYAPVLMASQCQTVASVLAGRDAGWRPQRRGDGRLPLRAVVRAHWGHTLLGAGLAALGWWIEPDLLWWLAPVTAGLVASIPLSALSSSVLLGRLTRWTGLGQVPTEVVVPEIIRQAEAALAGQAAFASPVVGPVSASAADVIAWLRAHPAERCWHFAQQTCGRLEAGGKEAQVRQFSDDLLVALAKMDRAENLNALADWLTPTQLRALLTYYPFQRMFEGAEASSTRTAG